MALAARVGQGVGRAAAGCVKDARAAHETTNIVAILYAERRVTIVLADEPFRPGPTINPTKDS
eukprot:scaffold48933_cov81-Phaeocystis_antarctica.AAC.2